MTKTDPARPAARVRGRAGFRRLLVSVGIAGGGLSAMYTGVGTILLPLQIEHIGRAHKIAALGVVAGVSAVFALIFNPIGGALSDRTRSRFGRRAPWLVFASAGVLVLLGLLGQAATVLLVLVAWCLAQAVANTYQAPLTAVIPDRVAPARRGAASSVAGVASVLGGVAGVGLASQFSGHLSLGYLILGAVLVLSAWYFVLSTADPPTDGLARPPRDTRAWGARLGTFVSALRHRDFACVFASRAAAILGYFLVISYELYILTDYIRLPHGMKPAQGVTVLAAISAVGAILAAAVAGPISDRLDRRKPFVILSSAIAGAGCILPVVSPTFGTIEIFAALAGLAFGCYLSVDAALVTLVLPRSEDAARDLGVLNIANAGPQVIAPLFAALIISHLGGYRTLFIVGGCCGIVGALAVTGVRSVR
ncbi:MAG TPA: MFS transporter [Streptosporangiaceae bacterium]|nr:MFS transporter [Streptosporangiaceae bacterium]